LKEKKNQTLGEYGYVIRERENIVMCTTDPCISNQVF